ncbi:hypothetical protein GGF32_008947 [Allomyces javanicus]|nr:hypothetical protein GGF32_008947 [Allomyces javanicus]
MATTTPTAVDPTAQDTNPEASPTSFLGPNYELNPRYHDALAAYFTYLDMDKVGYLTPGILAAEISIKQGSSAGTLFSVPEDLLRKFCKAANIEFRDSDLGIGLDAYINM